MTKSIIKFALSLTALAAMMAFLHTVPAQAASKTWVSNVGVNSATCGDVTSPCQTFAFAVNNVAAGGEVGVLNPGDYGGMQINKSVTITNDGTGEARLTSNAGGGIILVFAGVGDVVGLRGLIVDGQGGTAQFGIEVEQVSAVHIQNCVIRNVQATQSWGIFFSSNGKLFVSDSIIYNNGSTASSGGVQIGGLPNVSNRALLDRVRLENNVIGLLVNGILNTGGGSRVLVRDSVVSGNAGNGVFAASQPGSAPALVVVEHSSAVSNAGTGLIANGQHAIIFLNDNTITQNGTGMSVVNSGQIISFGNNKNFNNLGPEGAPTGFFSEM